MKHAHHSDNSTFVNALRARLGPHTTDSDRAAFEEFLQCDPFGQELISVHWKPAAI